MRDAGNCQTECLKAGVSHARRITAAHATKRTMKMHKSGLLPLKLTTLATPYIIL